MNRNQSIEALKLKAPQRHFGALFLSWRPEYGPVAFEVDIKIKSTYRQINEGLPALT